MATSQDFVNWVCSERLDHRFLKYVLMAEGDALLQFASGTTHQTIYFPEVKAFHVCLPSKSEQIAIANVLSALDEKIELNRRRVETLEAMARALFKSWFVDFDPVRAKLEDRPTGLSDKLAALFPAAFDQMDMPAGWEKAPLGSLFEISGGNTPSTKDPSLWEGQHEWATPKDLSSLTSPVLIATERRLTDAGLAVSNSGLLPPGSLLFSSRAPIGYMAFTTRPTAINQGFAGFKRGGASTAFAWCWCTFNLPTIKANAGGSTFPEISKAVLRELPVLRPPQNILDAFSELVDPLVARLVLLAQEADTLAGLRDTVLPRLISGELRVDDAATAIEAA